MPKVKTAAGVKHFPYTKKGKMATKNFGKAKKVKYSME